MGTSTGPGAEPTVAEASPARWYAWLLYLVTYGKARLAAVGVTLGLGLVLAMLALYVFAVLANSVMADETEIVDFAVLAALREVQSPGLNHLALFFSLLGSEVLAVLMVGLLILFGRKRRWGSVVSLLLVVVGAQMLNNVLKDWFHRTRPAPVEGLIPAQAFSFPSGHAMVAAAFYLFIGYLAWRLLKGRTRIICAALLVVIALLIGLSRLYLGVHYLTDVVAGYTAGIAWTDAVIVGGHLLARRRLARAGAPPPPALTAPSDAAALPPSLRPEPTSSA